MHSCLGQLAVSFERCARSTCHSNLQTHMRQHEGQVLTMIRNAVWAGSSQLTGIKAQFPLVRPERHKGMCANPIQQTPGSDANSCCSTGSRPCLTSCGRDWRPRLPACCHGRPTERRL